MSCFELNEIYPCVCMVPNNGSCCHGVIFLLKYIGFLKTSKEIKKKEKEKKKTQDEISPSVQGKVCNLSSFFVQGNSVNRKNASCKELGAL